MSRVEGSNESERSAGFIRRHWVALGAGAAVVVLLAVGGIWRLLHPSVAAEYRTENVAFRQPPAERLTPSADERVYRIDPTRSSVQYAVEEQIVGVGAHTAEGVTNGIAGDIAVNTTDARRSRVGEIVVNLEQLHSDNSLRDARIRKDFLQSHRFPLARFDSTGIRGLEPTITAGKPQRFELLGNLVIRGRTVPVVWDATGSLSDASLDVTAKVRVKLSDFGVGPIALAGLVTTRDDAMLTMRLVAKDVSRGDVSTTVPTPNSARATSAAGPSFKTEVQPILEANCASCHNRGEVGSGAWALDTAGDAARYADGVGTVVHAKYMPPWPASDAGVALENAKAMSVRDIAVIRRWAGAGGVLDVAASTPVRPGGGPRVPQPRADLTIRAGRAYAGSLDRPDDYRCFLMDPEVDAPTWLTGYEVLPEHRDQIHHVQFFRVDRNLVARARASERLDAQGGWDCGDVLALSAAMQPGLIGASARVQDPTVFPTGSGIVMHSGDALIMQMHYHYHSTPVPDRPAVALQMSPGRVENRAISIVNPVAPVEIPCLPSQVSAPLCDRNASLAEATRRYGPAAMVTVIGIHGICGTSPEQLAATFENGVASSSCRTKIPQSGRIISVFGHMHTIGSSFRMTLEPDAPTREVLLDIPRWNFGWQLNYTLERPQRVTAGQTVQMECTWDRALDPTRPPQYITFQEGTEDEMCFGIYALIPDSAKAARATDAT